MAPAADADGMGRSVLVLAGDPGLADAVRLALERSGFEATIAARREEALQCWNDGDFDATVVDLGLPHGAGYGFVAELRSTGDAAPVLLLTAPHAPEDVLSVQRGWPDQIESHS